MFFNGFNVLGLSMDIDEITEKILDESGYIEDVTENGYPQYTREQALEGVESVQQEKDLELLKKLEDGQGLRDIFYTNIGEDLDRLEEKDMIERPSTGDNYVKLTRLSRTYLQYHRRIQ